MNNQFFEKPILNSPYGYPVRHWELDAEGQPLSANAITPRRFVQFLLTQFPQLIRFLRWAADLPRWP